MASYTVLASQSTVQVLSPTLIVDAFQTTIQTTPSSVIANYTMPQTHFDDGSAASILDTYAGNIEAIIATGQVIAGVGVQTLDENGLLQEAVDFTVAYTPPDSTTGPLTVQVTISNFSVFRYNAVGGPAKTAIDKAYANLILLSGGTPPPPGPPGSGGPGGTGGGTGPPPPPPAQ